MINSKPKKNGNGGPIKEPPPTDGGKGGTGPKQRGSSIKNDRSLRQIDKDISLTDLSGIQKRNHLLIKSSS